MTIRSRLTILATLTFGIIFLIASLIVYFIFHTGTNQLILNELEKNCRLTALFYLEEDELSNSQYREVESAFMSNSITFEVKIFDENNRLFYGDSATKMPFNVEELNQIRTNGIIKKQNGDWFHIGIFYPDNQGDFVVCISEENELAGALMKRLLVLLAVVLLIGLMAIYILSRKLANLAYQPIQQLVEEIPRITAESLSKREQLPLPKTKDEVFQLINKFNILLNKLSDNFNIQQNFIRYVSHELKTPLAAITGNLEVFASKTRTAAEYQVVSKEVLKLVEDIQQILGTLLLVSGAANQESSKKDELRIDDLLIEILESYQSQYNNIEISFNIEIDDNEAPIVFANQVQLQMALGNIIENALKYSNGKPVKIDLYRKEKQIKIAIQDKGVGITENDLKTINQPFFRGQNVGNIKGSGIGLSVAFHLLALNQVKLTINSEINKGTLAILEFKT